ncbi:MAG: hypothetical protein ACFB4I_08740 [Cyanophyceae cyanobacterium]
MDCSEPNTLLTEFHRERSIRRTAMMLETKRLRIRDELEQLIAHVPLLVPTATQATDAYSASDLLKDAAARIGDDAFAQLLLAILQEIR